MGVGNNDKNESMKFSSKDQLKVWLHSFFQYSKGIKVFFSCYQSKNGFLINGKILCHNQNEIEKVIGNKDDYLVVDCKKNELICFIQNKDYEEEFRIYPDGHSETTWSNDFRYQEKYTEDQLRQSSAELKKAG
jgi:hypothetical protein